MSNLPDDETEKEFRQSIIRWFGRGEQTEDNFQIPPEMSDPPSKVIDPMLDIYHYSIEKGKFNDLTKESGCLLYTSPSPRDS